MSEVFTGIISDRTAWTGPDLATDQSWLCRFAETELAEIDAALRGAQARGLGLGDIEKATFPLPTLGPRLAEHMEELRTGRGFVVLRGLPVAKYTDEEVGAIFWGLGTHMGVAVRQNPRGDLLGHVFDHGSRYGDLNVRGYQTNARLRYHSDAADTVGLLCLRKAKSGGLSSIVSSTAIHNEIQRRHPEYLEPLYRGFYYIRREAALTESPVTPRRIPVYGQKDGLVSCRLVRDQIIAATVKTGKPLEDIEMKALDFMAELSEGPGLHLDMDLEPGDIQFLNNYVVMHSRTGFEDWPEPERRRHMQRLWLTFPERRPLPEGFPAQNGYGLHQIVQEALKD